MMNSKIRLLSTAIALLLSAASLISCASGGPATTTGETTPENAVTTAPVETAPPTSAPVEEDDGWVSAVFGGGPFVTGLSSGKRGYLDKIRASGYNTIIVWSVHVHDDGSLWLNDVEVARGGELVANKRTIENWGKLKGNGSTVKRVELSIGAWGCKDFEAIGAMMKRDGTGKDTELYKNFKALIDAYHADAINYDDETCYDPAILTQFGKMCVDMGVKVTLCPFNNIGVWEQVAKNLGDAVDRVYVQCYDGGAGNYNNLADWKRTFKMDVIPGLWATKTDIATIETFLKDNKRSITGCFYWLFDEMKDLKSPKSFEDYGKVINDANKFKED